MTTNVADNAQPPINFDTLVDKFVRLRDKIKAIEAKHKDELAPFKDMRDVLESTLLTHLNAINADNVKTPHGTVYKSHKDSATIADRTLFWGWVEQGKNWDYIDVKANVTAVRDLIKATQAAPPGITFSSVQTVGVKRAGKDT